MSNTRAHFWQGVYRVADPKITLASVAGMVLGVSAAAYDGPLAWGWVVVTALGIVALEAAKNASGEVYDWDSGTDQAVAPEDRSPFSGGKRVLVDGLMTRRQALATAAVFYGLGAAAGLAVVVWREPRVLWLGAIGVMLAFFYHAPPLRLSYRGLGELAVALAYGPGITAGTYLVQRGTVSTEVVLLSLPLGLAIAGFLWINEFPDRKADESAGKRTLVVQLGANRAAHAFALLFAAVFTAVAVLPLAGLPWPVLIGFAGLPPALGAARRLVRDPDTTASVVPAQAATLLAFLLLSAGLSLGLALDRWLR